MNMSKRQMQIYITIGFRLYTVDLKALYTLLLVRDEEL